LLKADADRQTSLNKMAAHISHSLQDPHYFQMLPLRSPKLEKSENPNSNWFETTIYSGAVILGVIKFAASMAPIPYLRQSARMSMNIMNTIQV